MSAEGGTKGSPRRARKGALLVFAVMLASTTATAQTQPPPLTPAELQRACDQAAQLTKDEHFADAEKLYRSLLGRADCADDGLAAALEKESAAAATDAAFDGRIAKIRALQRQGFNAEARKELQAVITDFPDRTIPKDVREPTQQLGAWRRFLGRIGPLVITLLEIALAVFVIFFVGRFVIRRFTKRVQLAGFDAAADTMLALSLPRALNDHLDNLRAQGYTTRLQSQSAKDADFDTLPATVVTAVPQANLIASLMELLDRLLPRRIIDVTGTVREVDPVHGAGVTIAISRRDGVNLAQETFWEGDYWLKPPAVDFDKNLANRYAQLLGPGAVWLAFRPELKYRPGTPHMGTTNWRSLALLAAGEIAWRFGRHADARAAYEAALDLDPENLGAKLNLGSLLLRPAAGANGYPDEDGATTAERLSLARRLLESVVAGASDPKTPLPYRARYLAAICDLYLNEPDHAVFHLEELRRLLRVPENRTAVEPLPSTLAPAVAVLLKTAHVVSGGDPPDLSAFTYAWKPVATEYNLACLCNRVADRSGMSRASRLQWREKSLEHLAKAIERDPAMIREVAKLDPALATIRYDSDCAARWRLLVDDEPAVKAGDAHQRIVVTLPLVAGLGWSSFR